MIIKQFFNELSAFLIDQIRPIGNLLDNDSALLKTAFEQLKALGALKLLIPTDCGGMGGGRSEWIEYNILLAQYSGALLFLQAQHQFSINELKKQLPNPSIQNFLKHISHTHSGLGVSLAANRKRLTIEKASDGFSVSGTLPWVTGFDFYSSLLFSFNIDDVIYYTSLPFQFNDKNTSFLISPKIDIAALNSTNTVSITLNNYLIDHASIISTKPSPAKTHTEHPSIYSFAGAIISLLTIAINGKYKNNEKIKLNHSVLLEEWQHYYENILENNTCPLTLRAQGLQLAQKCVNFARIACGAESLIASHPINRITREIWQYMIAGYSEDQLEAYLAVL